MARSVVHRGHELSAQQIAVAKPVLVTGTQRRWSTKKLEKAIDIALEGAGCPVPPKPERVGQHRTRGQFKLTCVGGPWDGQEVVFPKQEGSQYGGELSLPIRVGEHVGRYNLNTGHWVPLEMAE